MKKWTTALLVILLTWTVLAALQSAIDLDHIMSQFLGHIQVERTETSTHTSVGIDQLLVESRNGSITLLGNDEGDEIIIEAHYRARAASESSATKMLEQMTTRISQVGDRLVIQADFGNTSVKGAISYTITLPHSLIVDAKTSNGSVEAMDLSGDLNINTSNGRIVVISQQGPQNLVAHTSNGSIRINTVPESGGQYILRTSNGSVQVKLPEDLGVALKAQTSNGNITLGNGQWTHTREQSRRQVEAQRGNGEFRLEIVTSNGSIRLGDD